jgi:hypothetical protein
MDSTNPEHNLTPTELENLNVLEAVAQHGLGRYVQVAKALTEIRDRRLYRDSHDSFEAYVRERWGVDISEDSPSSEVVVSADTRVTAAPQDAPPRDEPCQALARACQQTLSALGDDERMAVEIRLAVRKPGDEDASPEQRSWDPWQVADAMGDELVPTLRWLLTQASGTIGRVAHQLERRATDVDEAARVQLRDDVLVLDDELAALKAMLLAIDWDSELGHLLRGELPPFDSDGNPGDDD